MRTEHTNEQPLFEIAGAQSAETRPAPRDEEKVPATPEGDNSAEIIRDWVNFFQQNTEVPIPGTIIKRLARQIKGLIKSGYHTVQIKKGLTVWTFRWFTNADYSPNQLDTLTWAASVADTPSGQQFRTEFRSVMRPYIQANPAVAQSGPAQNRNAINDQAQSDWQTALANRRQGKNS